jgi:predicted aspartyl protease
VPDPLPLLIRCLPALLALIGLAGCATAPPEQSAACRPVPRAELPLTVLRNFLLVPAALDGGKVMMVVDTGAEATTVTPETVQTLGLAWEPSSTMLLGVGGSVQGGGTVRLRHIELGGVKQAGLDLDVGRLPSLSDAGQPVAGLLGVDVLGGYDVELDLPNHTMTLYAVPHCPGFVPPGYDAADGHDLQRIGGGLLFVSVQVDGRSVRALLDTGARSSLVAQRVAAGLGVTENDLAQDQLVPGRGIGADPVAFRRHRFDEVRVGGVAVRDMTVNIAALPIAGIDMLLGADWLTGHKVWISRAAGRLFQR